LAEAFDAFAAQDGASAVNPVALRLSQTHRLSAIPVLPS
jgi:hypothetical protein